MTGRCVEVFRRACPQQATEQRPRAVAAAIYQGQWLSVVISQRALVQHEEKEGHGVSHCSSPFSYRACPRLCSWNRASSHVSHGQKDTLGAALAQDFSVLAPLSFGVGESSVTRAVYCRLFGTIPGPYLLNARDTFFSLSTPSPYPEYDNRNCLQTWWNTLCGRQNHSRMRTTVWDPRILVIDTSPDVDYLGIPACFVRASAQVWGLPVCVHTVPHSCLCLSRILGHWPGLLVLMVRPNFKCRVQVPQV